MKNPEKESLEKDEIEQRGLEIDLRYVTIQEELERGFLDRTGAERLSEQHQNYLYGDPTNPEQKTLQEEAREKFEELYSEDAEQYAQQEKVRVYDTVENDPTFRSLEADITKKTNFDPEVQDALQQSNPEYSEIWDKTYRNERLHGLGEFVEQYPEKVQGYAERWKDFVGQNPEIKEMNNREWYQWCDEHPGDYDRMNKYRMIARAAGFAEKRKEQSQSKKESEKEAEQEKESFRERAEHYWNEIDKLASHVANLWARLPASENDRLQIFAGYPNLQEIDNFGGEYPVSKYVESRVKWIEQQVPESYEAQSRMLYRFGEDLGRIREALEEVLA